MALKVWLPLTGDLNCKGLYNTTVTNYGATVNNDGKIGKCYEFDGVDDYLQLTNFDMSSIGEFSITCWVNPTSAFNYLFLVRGGGTHQIRISGDGFMFRDIHNSTQRIISFGNEFTGNEWVHLSCVYNHGEIFLYQNGIQTAHNISYYHTDSVINTGCTEIRIGRQQSSTGNSYYSGLINDFRIYDHVLSAKEIKEISKGLVLHYPLNRNGFGQDNIISGTGDWLTWYKGTRWTISDGVLTYSAGSVAWNDADSPCIPWSNVDGKTITISVDLKSDDYNFTSGSSRGFSLCLVRKSTQETQNFQNRRRECTPIFIGSDKKNEITSQWKTFTYTYINFTDNDFTKTYNDGGGDWFGIYLWNYCDKSISVRNIKLEFGDKATPWTPSQVDMLYSKMGLEDNIEYDISGYQNNGISNNISYSTNTPRYYLSSVFNGSSSIIKSQSLPEETKTISIWLRTTWSTPSGYRLVVHDKKTGLAIGFSSNQLITYVGSGNGGSGSRVIYTDYYTANEWNHIVVVKTGNATRDVYINGQFITPSSRNYWGGDLEELNIGARHIKGSYAAFFNGELSDFRAYVTALSADDVLELYHNPASITSFGVLMTQGELSEV